LGIHGFREDAENEKYQEAKICHRQMADSNSPGFGKMMRVAPVHGSFPWSDHDTASIEMCNTLATPDSRRKVTAGFPDITF
jgi:hypothetical protein